MFETHYHAILLAVQHCQHSFVQFIPVHRICIMYYCDSVSDLILLLLIN